MSGKIDEMAGFIGGVSPNSGTKASGEMADGLNSQTLIENSAEKGVLSDGVRVSEEAKVLVGELSSGSVISGTEFKSVEFGNLGTNDKGDANKNRVVASASRSNIKWESRVMSMVGRVLDGKLHMDNEVDDVDDSKSRRGNYLVAEKDAWQNANKKVNLVADKDAWQDEIGEPTSENKIGFKQTDNDNDVVMLDSSSPDEESGLKKGNQDLISHGTVLNMQLKSKKRFDANRFLYKLKARGENDITEKEGNYYVSDLVWGKVSCHPWWPGQIFSPQSATEEASMHLKDGSYFIAYFGDRTFAWNKESKIKPFGMYFSKMDQQSNSEKFSHAVQSALDEASRRVEFGLSCPCLPPKVRDGLKFQVIENAGIVEESNRRAGGDVLYGAATFSPGDLLQSLESLARCPQSIPDRLQFTIKKAQLLSYNRWKGRYLLPVYEECHAFLEQDTLLNAKDKKAARVPEIYSDEKYMRGARNVISCGENREMVNPVASTSKGRRGRKPKNLLPISPTQTEEKISRDIPTPDSVLTRLCLLAIKPMQGHDAMIPMVGLLCDFRKFVCSQTLSQKNDEMDDQPVFENGNGFSSKKRKSTAQDGSSRKRKEKYMSVLMSSGSSSSVATDKNPVRRGPTTDIFSGENRELVNCVGGVDIAVDSGNHTSEEPSSFQTADTFGIGGINDPYWPDVIIHPNSQPEADADAAKKYCPTAIRLKFDNLEAIPAISRLNEIFCVYGPLIESETKILTKSKRAKVVFERKEDAQTAFSSSGKYQTFGPALISYQLECVPKVRQALVNKNEKTNP